MIRIEAMVASWAGGVSRPAKDRRAIARALVAKAVYNMSTTRQLPERLSVDSALRRICGWESRREIPHESQFSRAFAEFAETELPQRLHDALIARTQEERLIGHLSRDSTEIESREKPPPLHHHMRQSGRGLRVVRTVSDRAGSLGVRQCRRPFTRYLANHADTLCADSHRKRCSRCSSGHTQRPEGRRASLSVGKTHRQRWR
jgi:Transposase domain (DUF772)